MKTLVTHGCYSVIMYDENLVTIDFTNEHVGLTIKAFSNKEKALIVFSEKVKCLTSHKATLLNDDVRKSIIYSD